MYPPTYPPDPLGGVSRGHSDWNPLIQINRLAENSYCYNIAIFWARDLNVLHWIKLSLIGKHRYYNICSHFNPNLTLLCASVPGLFDSCQIRMKHGPNRFSAEITWINHHTFGAGSMVVGRWRHQLEKHSLSEFTNTQSVQDHLNLDQISFLKHGWRVSF